MANQNATEYYIEIWTGWLFYQIASNFRDACDRKQSERQRERRHAERKRGKQCEMVNERELGNSMRRMRKIHAEIKSHKFPWKNSNNFKYFYGEQKQMRRPSTGYMRAHTHVHTHRPRDENRNWLNFFISWYSAFLFFFSSSNIKYSYGCLAYIQFVVSVGRSVGTSYAANREIKR